VAPTGPVFLVAALAVGCTVAEIISTSLNSSRIAERVVRAALLYVGLWAIALCIAGCGVAMAWPHLSAWLMRAVDEPLEGGAAAVNLTTGDELAAARWLFAGFAVLTAIGMIGSFWTVGR
jgi:hypothetical protein